MNHVTILILYFISVFVFFAYITSKILNYVEKRQKMLDRMLAVTIKNKAFSEENEASAFKKNTESSIENQIARFLKNRPSIEVALRLKLYRAGITGYLGYLAGGALFFSFVIVTIFSIVNDSSYVSDIFYVLIVTGLSIYFILNFLENRFKRKVMMQLPLAVEIVLRGIKSGSSVEKTFATVIKEVGAPLKGEFSDIIQQIEFGVSFDTALHQAADRIDLSDFYFFTTSLIIQRKAGGSLSEILENIITSLNKANEIRAKINVLSAEAKVTAYILGGLPIALMIIMSQVNPDYIGFFFHEIAGKKLLKIACCMIVCAGLSIRYLIRVKT